MEPLVPSLFPAHSTCPIQDCTQENDVFGDHAIGCGHSGERTSRHNRLRDTIYKAATSACLAPSQEIRGLVSGSEAGPANVFIPSWDKGIDTALDVTVISPLQQSLVDRSENNHNTALDTAYRRKKTSAFQACADVNVSFIPLAVETFGGWHPDAVCKLESPGPSISDPRVCCHQTLFPEALHQPPESQCFNDSQQADSLP